MLQLSGESVGATVSPSFTRLSSSSNKNVAVRWFRVSGADLVFAVIAALVFLTARQGLLDDPGLGWHLRTIDAMLSESGWLTTDPFTHPQDGQPRPWYCNQWLGEIPFWLGERWAGLEGIAAVAALIIAFTLRYLYRMFLNDGLPWPAAVFWTSQAAMGISCSWVARPNLFTLLFVLLTARICVRYHEGSCNRKTTLWLLPLFALWANIHGGFIAGLVLLVATCLIETAIVLFALRPPIRQQARQRLVHLVLLSMGAFVCTLLNPYGLALYRWLFQLLGDPFFMDLHLEWKSPNFHGKGAIRFEWLMLLFPLLLAVSKRRSNLVELGLSLLWFHFALTGFRYVPLWIVIAVPLLARLSLNIPQLQAAAWHFLAERQGSSFFLSAKQGRSGLGVVLSAVVLLGCARLVQGHLACHQPSILPAHALDRFLQIQEEWRQTHGHRPIVFHSYDWGGYLTWHGGPDFRNWIDDRNEVQGKDHIQEYFAILETKPGWDEKIDRASVQLVCIQPEAPLTFRLAERSASWRELYRDTWAVIFERVHETCEQRNPAQ